MLAEIKQNLDAQFYEMFPDMVPAEEKVGLIRSAWEFIGGWKGMLILAGFIVLVALYFSIL